MRRALLLTSLAILGYALLTQPSFQTVAAGVAIFLFGMLFLEQGFQALTGGVLKRALARSTNSLPRSQLLGFVATALMQSSTLVTVITISTLSAGLISLAAGIGIIFGANIGTTTGAWIMAGFGLKVDIARYAMPLIVVGLVLVWGKRQRATGFGHVCAGLGFVFLGIHYMKTGFEVFSGSFDFAQHALTGLTGLLVYTLIGIGATVIMQSSHATLMLTIAALAASQITYDNALALAIGSNVGTTVTALLGALRANAAGKRLAWAHVLFNVITGAIALLLIEPFKWLVDGFSDLVGIADDNWTLRLAAFHTIFNVVGVAVMTPFIGRLVRLLETRVRERPVAEQAGVALEPQYLNESALALPDTAIEALERELRHLADNVFEVVAHGLNLHRADILSVRALDEVVAGATEIMDIDVTDRYYGSVKTLSSAIVDFATRAPVVSNMTEAQVLRVHGARLACRDAAEIIKALAQLRPNLNRYLTADNAAMREQYDALRRGLAGCLRALFGASGPPLDDLRAALAQQDALANGTLDRLVRARAITPTMATSLMNDSANATTIGNRLIDLARHLNRRPATLETR